MHTAVNYHSSTTRLSFRALSMCCLMGVAACGGRERVLDSGSPLDAGRVDSSSDASPAVDAETSIDAETHTVVDAGASGDAAVDAAGDVAVDAAGDAAVPSAPGLLALNLRCLDQTGTPYASVAERMRAIAEEILRDGVVAVLLEEVCDDGTTPALDVLTADLSTLSGDAWLADEVFAHVAWAGTPREARESVAILTRTAHHSVQSVEFFGQGALRRVGLMATLGAPLDGLRVMAVHFDHRDADARVLQARESAVASLATFGAAGALVGGDLNARVGSAPLAAFEAMGFVDEGASLPTSRIDHVLLHRGASFAAAETRLVFDTPATTVSDHPGILIRLAVRAPPSVSWTRVVGHVDVGVGHRLTLRGDTPPLDWSVGWPMFASDVSTWVFATAEVTAGFEYKVLVDDATWMTGANASGVAGIDNDVTPTF